jgi:murein DD-endopeptidase MepM/ murein hydrolase activator NlpD
VVLLGKGVIMRKPAMMVGAAATLTVAALACSTGSATADGATVPAPGLRTVAVTLPPLPVPTPTVPLPVPTPTVPTPTVPLPPVAAVPSVPAPSGGTGSPASGGSTSAAPTVPAPSGGATSAGAGRADRRQSTVKPMIVGRPEAPDMLDEESTPALERASKAFLVADTKIAALTTARAAMDAARAGAERAAASYSALQTDAANARAQAAPMHQRFDRLHAMIINDAVRSYQTGLAATDDESTRDLVAAARRADEAATQAEMQVGAAVTAQDRARTEADRLSAEYTAARLDLSNVDARLDSLGQQRATALTAANRAKSGDLARHRETIAESGQLGAEIRAASARLAATGRTVAGSGKFIRPSSGVITSPYGMRMHPILHYVKLHTGTDFAVGNGFSHAADTGRVLFTIVSVAYGNFTVIDHGTINGRHITTAYAHQAKFLVKPGDVVEKGQQIGIIGATGYATGPHLHFEVRDDGAVEDPMAWLAN